MTGGAIRRVEEACILLAGRVLLLPLCMLDPVALKQPSRAERGLVPDVKESVKSEVTVQQSSEAEKRGRERREVRECFL